MAAIKKEIPGGWLAKNVRPVGYCDMDGKPAFKMSIRERQGHWYLYTGHFWHSGWSIVDITDPEKPEIANFLSGPSNTWTLQVDLHGNTMVTALEKVFANFGGDAAHCAGLHSQASGAVPLIHGL